MAKKVFLLDALALIFRAYYALIRNPRLTSKGRNTNSQFGFTNALVELMNNQKPSHMAVCFDTAAPTERHTDFEAYKANRQEAPEDILDAIPDIKKIIRGFNIPVMELDGFEADDVIGTLSKQAAKAGYEVYMVTPDKDYGQLVSDKIKTPMPSRVAGFAACVGLKVRFGSFSASSHRSANFVFAHPVSTLRSVNDIGPEPKTASSWP